MDFTIADKGKYLGKANYYEHLVSLYLVKGDTEDKYIYVFWHVSTIFQCFYLEVYFQVSGLSQIKTEAIVCHRAVCQFAACFNIKGIDHTVTVANRYFVFPILSGDNCETSLTPAL